MKQRKQGTEIFGRMLSKNNLVYVQNVPGDGGVDWGFTSDRAKALPLNTYFARRFVADCRRVNAVAYRSYV